MAGPHRLPPAPQGRHAPGRAAGRVPPRPSGRSPAAAPHARAGGKRGSGRAPDSNRCSGGRRKLGEGDSPGGVEGGGESGRGVWKGSVEDSKGTRQKPGEEARQTAGVGRGVRGRTGRLWAPTAAARGTRPGSPTRRTSPARPPCPPPAPWWTGAPC